MFDRCQNISLGKTEENIKMVILSIRMNEYSTNMNTAYELALPIGSPLMAVSIFIPVLTISRERERVREAMALRKSHMSLSLSHIYPSCVPFFAPLHFSLRKEFARTNYSDENKFSFFRSKWCVCAKVCYCLIRIIYTNPKSHAFFTEKWMKEKEHIECDNIELSENEWIWMMFYWSVCSCVCMNKVYFLVE